MTLQSEFQGLRENRIVTSMIQFASYSNENSMIQSNQRKNGVMLQFRQYYISKVRKKR